ncbi:peroxiredoxin [Thalassotalea sp. HSM 43]|uniref:peroxiredoxin n=1 Tax=Thalassotalea sp. HSM 43 TaxID=2552945 RepID=UPI00107FFDBD|nr:peroxiredoxin [Thalassotalea sp. HSM 43]QBY04471.1 peroxiredoxin [Thalassotalea sp. HSM 43]
MIEVNKAVPAGELQQLTSDGMQVHQASELFAKGTSVVFAVPGAFTPTCSAAHLPGFVVNFDEFTAKGVDRVVCVAVNDAFVMDAWGKSANAENLMMLADGDGSYHKALGLSMETGGFGGVRSQRYAMVIKDGIVSQLFVEQPKQFEVSTAENVLANL